VKAHLSEIYFVSAALDGFFEQVILSDSVPLPTFIPSSRQKKLQRKLY